MMSDWLAAGSAFISALMALFSFFGAKNAQRSINASILAPHFKNIKDLIDYLKYWGGFSQDFINEKKDSIIYLKNYLSYDQDLLDILNKLDPWPNRQTVFEPDVEETLSRLMKKYLKV